MKKTILTACAVFAMSTLHAQDSKFNIDLIAGYNMPLGGKSFMLSNYTSHSVNGDGVSEEETLPFSVSKGFQLNLNIGYMFNENVGMDVGLGYLFGSPNKSEWNTSIISIGYLSTNITKEEWKSSLFKVNPSIMFKIPGERFTPYMKAGVEFGFGSVLLSSDSDRELGDLQVVEEFRDVRETKFDQGFGFGITGALGCSYNLGSNISILGELNFGTFAYKLKHSEVVKYEVNGQDVLSNVRTISKETNFVDKYVYDSTAPIDPDKPDEAASFNLPGSYLGFRLGVRYSF